MRLNMNETVGTLGLGTLIGGGLGMGIADGARWLLSMLDAPLPAAAPGFGFNAGAALGLLVTIVWLANMAKKPGCLVWPAKRRSLLPRWNPEDAMGERTQTTSITSPCVGGRLR